MTIYTPGLIDKESKNVIDPEVVTEPLTRLEEDDVEKEASPKLVRVTYISRSRRTLCLHLMLTIMVMVILTCGAIGAVLFYRHLNRKEVMSGFCGTRYYDPEYHEFLGEMDVRPGPQGLSMYKAQYTLDVFEESIEVSRVDAYENLHTPHFDEVQENTVWHDFQSNYTAIIDKSLGRCYIMGLDRKRIAPPSDVLDLLEKLMTGYYMRSASVMRENYRIVLPPVQDMSPFGKRIAAKCDAYVTFRMERFIEGMMFKRSAGKKHKGVPEDTLVYAMLSNNKDHPEIFKIFIHGAKQIKRAD